MSVRLLIAPSSAGKTEYVLQCARADAASLARQPILCVPAHIQARSAQMRLAQQGGVMGLRIFTFDELYDWLLRRAGVVSVKLTDAAQFRLMRTLLEQLASEGALRHYAGIAQTPGLATLMRELVSEMQNARVEPAPLLSYWRENGAPDRLLDIGTLYDAWEQALVRNGWSDRAGVGVCALKALQEGKVDFDVDATPIYFDGFDFLTELQLQLVVQLAQLPGAQITITLTGDPETISSPVSSSNRFDSTRQRLLEALGNVAAPLPPPGGEFATMPALRDLRERLNRGEFGAGAPQVKIVDAEGALSMLEASQRAIEVRAALRWVKRAIVQKAVSPNECALLVRDLTAWRATIVQIASEFGLPIELVGGLPLEQNPAINALLALLTIALPDANGVPVLQRDDLIALLRSPYFDLAPFGALSGDAERLDAFARGALVHGGLESWRIAFAAALTTIDKADAQTHEDVGDEEEDAERPSALLTRTDIARLATFVEGIAARLMPPQNASTSDHIDWLEGLLGKGDVHSIGFDFIGALAKGSPSERARDESALQAFKVILRGLLFSAEQIASPSLTYSAFLQEVGGALEGAQYALPAPVKAVFCAPTVQARGVPFSHVALLGMVEGELPRRTQDDPFLRDEDRIALRRVFPGVQRATESQEREYFVEAISRAESALLLTRPVIGENGAAAEPSPYWLEVISHFAGTPQSERSGALPDAALAASLPELMRSLAQIRHAGAEGWILMQHPHVAQAIEEGSHILRQRMSRARTHYDGDLRGAHVLLEQQFPARREWSPTAFEAWLKCPYFYLTSNHLVLEARSEVDAEIDRGTIGLIYHEILQALYSPSTGNASTEVASAEVASALDRLEEVANDLLASAPQRHVFLDTPLWQQQAVEIRANLRASVAALGELGGVPFAVEQKYRKESALYVTSDDGDFRVRGTIDRIDALPNGSLRIIDYKTGKSSYNTWKAVAEGKRLQLPLYALMVEGVLGEGKVSDGIYFFVHTGEAARWSLASYPEGADAATETALNWARGAVKGIRSGDFAPKAPSDGCPSYCPAAAFCWHYKPNGYA